MITKEQIEAKDATAKKSGFDQFMRQPLTSAVLSIMPPSEHIEVLLRAAFDHGYMVGSAQGIVHALEAIMGPRKPSQ